MKMTHGGKREGAGRRAIGISKTLSLTLDAETWEQVEQDKQEQNKSQSAILRSIIEDHYKPIEQADQQADERSTIWWELMRKNIFESYVEIKESQVKKCIQHWKYANEFKREVWRRCKENSKAQGYKKIGVKYLLDSFLFEGNQLQLDQNFESIEEQVIFAIIKHAWTHPQEVKVKEKPKGPEGTEDFVSLENIIVPEAFLKTTPNPVKTQKVVNYVKQIGFLDEPILINRDTMTLSDGYRRYIVAKQMKMDIVPVAYEKQT